MKSSEGRPAWPGVIVTYNPGAQAIECIHSNTRLLSHVVVVDNSDPQEAEHLEQSLTADNITYLSMRGNCGIGAALNAGLRALQRAGHAWAVTLDQDSLLPLEFMQGVTDALHELGDRRVGVLSPAHLKAGVAIERLPHAPPRFLDQDYVMMSGNLISLDAFTALGGFNEAFFMDYVDVDYCLRLRTAGFDVVMVPSIHLDHALGQSTWHAVGGVILKPTHHSALRRYYISRNRTHLLLASWVPREYKVTDILRLIKETVYIVLFEEAKLAKLGATVRGVVHARLGIQGSAT